MVLTNKTYRNGDSNSEENCSLCLPRFPLPSVGQHLNPNDNKCPKDRREGYQNFCVLQLCHCVEWLIRLTDQSLLHFVTLFGRVILAYPVCSDRNLVYSF